MWIFIFIFKKIITFPLFIFYQIYDHLVYYWYNKKSIFYGWGIHLFVGKFGAGKTSLMVIKAFKLCKKYPQLSILTNINLSNFPDHTQILPLKSASDIINAPDNTLILIDEIGTLFNSRDFCSGKNSVPKPLFQHLCQCRKRHLIIYATVQRFNLLDKQIRDISADVTECVSYFKHPFTRLLTGFIYDIDEYEAWCVNKLYNRRVDKVSVVVQTDLYRSLYDTSQLIEGLLQLTYLDDKDILTNLGSFDSFSDGSKEGQKAYRKAMKRRR